MVVAEQELKLENVLSIRKKMTQEEIQAEIIKIGSFLDQQRVNKNGPIVTATFGLEYENGQPLLDMEILVPLDRAIQAEAPYTFKNVFHLVHAIHSRYTGNMALLQNAYNEMLDYVNRNNLHQITVAYNAQTNELVQGQPGSDMTVDIYIGINPSKL